MNRLGLPAWACRRLASATVAGVVGEQRRHLERHPAVDAVAVRSWTGRNRSAARDRSSIASSKNSASPDARLTQPAIAASYQVLLATAFSKIVGLEVRPVTDSSSM